jgi:Domain of unknown function (DUF4037)
MTGLDLSRRFYQQIVAPLLRDRPHAAALLGGGSEVLGFDDDVSPDHDFGPRLQLFLPAGQSVEAELAALPAEFSGSAVTFPDSHGDGASHHHIEVTTAGAYFRGRLGVDPAGGLALADWLLAPTQVLATLTAGEVFHDPAGELALRRDRLSWYPDDIWRYALAAAWLRVEQEEPFVGRAGSTADDLGSRIVAARVGRDLIRLAFLIERRWAPYSKWLGRAFAGLRLSAKLGPLLLAAQAADDWRGREDAIVTAASVVAAATNDLGLGEPLDPAPRQFHTRDIRVLAADRYAIALAGSITDPEVRALLDRLGHRRGAAIGALPGTIDQAVDSTDVLMHPARCRAAAPMLGLLQLGLL